MINKPPRPPCWRDFLPESPSTTTSTSQHPPQPSHNSHKPRKPQRHQSNLGVSTFTDLSQSHRSKSDGDAHKWGASGVNGHIGGTGGKLHQSQQHHKDQQRSSSRHKKKLHRTRSELSIIESELPEVQLMTINLADTNPGEFTLRGRERDTRGFDSRIYLDENARRCRRWLAGLKASEPLEDVTSSTAQGSEVELEIPEENWQNLGQVRRTPAVILECDIESVSVYAEPVDRGSHPGNTQRHRDAHRDTHVDTHIDTHIDTHGDTRGDTHGDSGVQHNPPCQGETSAADSAVVSDEGTHLRGDSPCSDRESCRVLPDRRPPKPSQPLPPKTTSRESACRRHSSHEMRPRKDKPTHGEADSSFPSGHAKPGKSRAKDSVLKACLPGYVEHSDDSGSSQTISPEKQHATL